MATHDSNEDRSSPAIPARDPEPEVNLAHLEPVQRAQFLKQYFRKRVEPLAYIDAPDECTVWPGFNDEIIEAYLRYTTFTVKVWTNYDAATKKFYLDDRQQDCGKIILYPSERRRLEQVDPDGTLQFNRIRLDIGTAFTNLCEVKLSALPSKLGGSTDISLRGGRTDTDHPRVVDFVQNTCNHFNDSDFTTTNDQHGFILADIEQIAAWFCRKPTQAQIGKLSWSPNAGPFITHDSENPAWVDFEDMGKECSIGCKGCSGSKYYRYNLGGFTSRYW